MVYGVNNTELGINEILQLIELTLGEGDFSKYYIYQRFIYNIDTVKPPNSHTPNSYTYRIFTAF